MEESIIKSLHQRIVQHAIEKSSHKEDVDDDFIQAEGETAAYELPTGQKDCRELKVVQKKLSPEEALEYLQVARRYLGESNATVKKLEKQVEVISTEIIDLWNEKTTNEISRTEYHIRRRRYANDIDVLYIRFEEIEMAVQWSVFDASLLAIRRANSSKDTKPTAELVFDEINSILQKRWTTLRNTIRDELDQLVRSFFETFHKSVEDVLNDDSDEDDGDSEAGSEGSSSVMHFPHDDFGDEESDGEFSDGYDSEPRAVRTYGGRDAALAALESRRPRGNVLLIDKFRKSFGEVAPPKKRKPETALVNGSSAKRSNPGASSRAGNATANHTRDSDIKVSCSEGCSETVIFENPPNAASTEVPVNNLFDPPITQSCKEKRSKKDLECILTSSMHLLEKICELDSLEHSSLTDRSILPLQLIDHSEAVVAWAHSYITELWQELDTGSPANTIVSVIKAVADDVLVHWKAPIQSVGTNCSCASIRSMSTAADENAAENLSFLGEEDPPAAINEASKGYVDCSPGEPEERAWGLLFSLMDHSSVYEYAAASWGVFQLECRRMEDFLYSNAPCLRSVRCKARINSFASVCHSYSAVLLDDDGVETMPKPNLHQSWMRRIVEFKKRLLMRTKKQLEQAQLQRLQNQQQRQQKAMEECGSVLEEQARASELVEIQCRIALECSMKEILDVLFSTPVLLHKALESISSRVTLESHASIKEGSLSYLGGQLVALWSQTCEVLRAAGGFKPVQRQYSSCGFFSTVDFNSKPWEILNHLLSQSIVSTDLGPLFQQAQVHWCQLKQLRMAAFHLLFPSRTTADEEEEVGPLPTGMAYPSTVNAIAFSRFQTQQFLQDRANGLYTCGLICGVLTLHSAVLVAQKVSCLNGNNTLRSHSIVCKNNWTLLDLFLPAKRSTEAVDRQLLAETEYCVSVLPLLFRLGSLWDNPDIGITKLLEMSNFLVKSHERARAASSLFGERIEENGEESVILLDLVVGNYCRQDEKYDANTDTYCELRQRLQFFAGLYHLSRTPETHYESLILPILHYETEGPSKTFSPSFGKHLFSLLLSCFRKFLNRNARRDTKFVEKDSIPWKLFRSAVLGGRQSNGIFIFLEGQQNRTEILKVLVLAMAKELSEAFGDDYFDNIVGASSGHMNLGEKNSDSRLLMSNCLTSKLLNGSGLNTSGNNNVVENDGTIAIAMWWVVAVSLLPKNVAGGLMHSFRYLMAFLNEAIIPSNASEPLHVLTKLAVSVAVLRFIESFPDVVTMNNLDILNVRVTFLGHLYAAVVFLFNNCLTHGSAKLSEIECASSLKFYGSATGGLMVLVNHILHWTRINCWGFDNLETVGFASSQWDVSSTRDFLRESLALEQRIFVSSLFNGHVASTQAVSSNSHFKTSWMPRIKELFGRLILLCAEEHESLSSWQRNSSALSGSFNVQGLIAVVKEVASGEGAFRRFQTQFGSNCWDFSKSMVSTFSKATLVSLLQSNREARHARALSGVTKALPDFISIRETMTLFEDAHRLTAVSRSSLVHLYLLLYWRDILQILNEEATLRSPTAVNASFTHGSESLLQEEVIFPHLATLEISLLVCLRCSAAAPWVAEAIRLRSFSEELTRFAQRLRLLAAFKPEELKSGQTIASVIVDAAMLSSQECSCLNMLKIHLRLLSRADVLPEGFCVKVKNIGVRASTSEYVNLGVNKWTGKQITPFSLFGELMDSLLSNSQIEEVLRNGLLEFCYQSKWTRSMEEKLDFIAHFFRKIESAQVDRVGNIYDVSSQPLLIGLVPLASMIRCVPLPGVAFGTRHVYWHFMLERLDFSVNSSLKQELQRRCGRSPQFPLPVIDAVTTWATVFAVCGCTSPAWKKRWIDITAGNNTVFPKIVDRNRFSEVDTVEGIFSSVAQQMLRSIHNVLQLLLNLDDNTSMELVVESDQRIVGFRRFILTADWLWPAIGKRTVERAGGAVLAPSETQLQLVTSTAFLRARFAADILRQSQVLTTNGDPTFERPETMEFLELSTEELVVVGYVGVVLALQAILALIGKTLPTVDSISDGDSDSMFAVANYVLSRMRWLHLLCHSELVQSNDLSLPDQRNLDCFRFRDSVLSLIQAVCQAVAYKNVTLVSTQSSDNSDSSSRGRMTTSQVHESLEAIIGCCNDVRTDTPACLRCFQGEVGPTMQTQICHRCFLCQPNELKSSLQLMQCLVEDRMQDVDSIRRFQLRQKAVHDVGACFQIAGSDNIVNARTLAKACLAAIGSHNT